MGDLAKGEMESDHICEVHDLVRRDQAMADSYRISSMKNECIKILHNHNTNSKILLWRERSRKFLQKINCIWLGLSFSLYFLTIKDYYDDTYCLADVQYTLPYNNFLMIRMVKSYKQLK